MLGAVRRDAGRCAAMGGAHLPTTRLRTERERASGRNGQHHPSRTVSRSPVVMATLPASTPASDGYPCLRLPGEDDRPRTATWGRGAIKDARLDPGSTRYRTGKTPR